MERTLFTTVALLCLLNLQSPAQDPFSNGKALNLPLKKYGLSIGNSYEFSGLRINALDKGVKKVNGVNITLWTRFKRDYNNQEVVNGISAGILTSARKMQPLNLFIVGVLSFQNLNGLTISGIGAGSGEINGICGSGIYIQGGKVNGISLAGLMSYSDYAFNGLSLGGLVVASKGNINGISASIAGIYSMEKVNGVSVTAGYFKSGITNGLTIAGVANIREVHGLSIALFNYSRDLKGVQLGILNYAGNNRRGLKLLPLLNMHFEKRRDLSLKRIA